jgi:outer membrane biosynthesis protein TonB
VTSTKIEDFIEAVFAKNKAMFGDARMELDPEPTPEPTPDPESEDKPEEPDEKPEEKPSPEDELPEWAQKERTQLRAEAANYRTRLREAEQKLTDAKTPEEVEAAVAELREQNAALERSILVRDVASEFSLPKALADRLVGSTKEELEADAKELAKLVPAVEDPAPGRVEGGLTPLTDEADELPNDPRELARRHRRI